MRSRRGRILAELPPPPELCCSTAIGVAVRWLRVNKLTVPRHRDLKTMRGYVRRAKLVTESASKLHDL